MSHGARQSRGLRGKSSPLANHSGRLGGALRAVCETPFIPRTSGFEVEAGNFIYFLPVFYYFAHASQLGFYAGTRKWNCDCNDAIRHSSLLCWTAVFRGEALRPPCEGEKPWLGRFKAEEVETSHGPWSILAVYMGQILEDLGEIAAGKILPVFLTGFF